MRPETSINNVIIHTVFAISLISNENKTTAQAEMKKERNVCCRCHIECQQIVSIFSLRILKCEIFILFFFCLFDVLNIWQDINFMSKYTKIFFCMMTPQQQQQPWTIFSVLFFKNKREFFPVCSRHLLMIFANYLKCHNVSVSNKNKNAVMSYGNSFIRNVFFCLNALGRIAHYLSVVNNLSLAWALKNVGFEKQKVKIIMNNFTDINVWLKMTLCWTFLLFLLTLLISHKLNIIKSFNKS